MIGEASIGEAVIGGEGTLSIESTITIEMNCFTRQPPGINVDSTRLIRLRTFTEDGAVYIFNETKVLSSGR